MLLPLEQLSAQRFETPAILKQLTRASRQLAELKGVAAAIPNQGILINTLSLQEAKDSSEVENIITTHDEIFQTASRLDTAYNPAAKEVLHYAKALHTGFGQVREHNLLTVRQLTAIQATLEPNNQGIRTQMGTTLKDSHGKVIYTPPQRHDDIMQLLADLERFTNEPSLFDADPLIKMALIHHRFESIHPFWDGNGRTGRIVNVLYLFKEQLLDIPVLYLSRYLVRHKAEYYARLQAVRDHDDWENWVLFMLMAVEDAAASSIKIITAIRGLLLATKKQIRDRHSFYSQDLINHLFSHPYTKIAFIEDALKVSRITAAKYLNELVADNILVKRKRGRSNYYINMPLFNLLAGENEAQELGV